MAKAEPFYLYHVVDATGQTKTSSIIYCPGMTPDTVVTPEEIRTTVLEAALMCASEYDWPEHGENDKGMTLEIFGPFFPAEPASSLTQAAYNAIDENDLP